MIKWINPHWPWDSCHHRFVLVKLHGQLLKSHKSLALCMLGSGMTNQGSQRRLRQIPSTYHGGMANKMKESVNKNNVDFFQWSQHDRQTGRQADRQTDRQTGRQTDRQADRQADRQTDSWRPAVDRMLCFSRVSLMELPIKCEPITA